MTSADTDRTSVGAELYSFIEELYPICRSITGDGVRETLRRIGNRTEIEVSEVPTGTPAFDWTVPKEWNIRDAFIKDSTGQRIVDFRAHNLHVMSYSCPVSRRISRQELEKHLHSVPDHPDWIPYRTSYYSEDWAFCLTEKQRLQLSDSEYEVCVDSTLADGSLSYGEAYLPGETKDEVLFFTHICHPSLCNDNLTGIAILTFLAAYLREQSRRLSYRFVWAPGTIGSIVWLSRNHKAVQRIRGGLVLALLGDSGPLTYKRSRRGDAEIDRVVSYVLARCGVSANTMDFAPYGYDERQFCSPGFNLPIGRLTRTPNGEYPQYHTSADDLKFVDPGALADSFAICVEIVKMLERNATYINLKPHCEPQLGRRGLYRRIGGQDVPDRELAMLWLLNLADGEHSVLDIAERSGIEFNVLHTVVGALVDAELIEYLPGEELS